MANIIKQEVEIEVVGELTGESKVIADNFVAQLLSKETNNPLVLIESVGVEESKNLRTISKSLAQPISNLFNEDSDSEQMGKDLIGLKSRIEELMPSKYDLNPGWVGRMFYKITGSSATNKFFTKFQTSQSVIDTIASTLEEGKVTLLEDNAIFLDDKNRYRQILKDLKAKLEILVYTDNVIEEKIKNTSDLEEREFLMKEISFPLKQKTLDIQQIISVTSQGIAALDMLISSNQILIAGVQRVTTLSLAALSIGVTVAGGLVNQKRVISVNSSVNNTTNNMIANNAKMLKTQGAIIREEASRAVLDLATLTKSLEDTLEAINDIEEFKLKAIPDMSKSINSLNAINSKFEQSIQMRDRGEHFQIEA